jgi:hypothetical protein
MKVWKTLIVVLVLIALVVAHHTWFGIEFKRGIFTSFVDGCVLTSLFLVADYIYWWR